MEVEGCSCDRLLGFSSLPAWPLEPGLPVATAESLTGLWIPLPSGWLPLPSRRVDASGRDPIAPGPVERAVGCQYHYGVEAVMMQRSDSRVTARWVYEPGASGAENREWSSLDEVAEGNAGDAGIQLSGVRILRSGFVDAPEVQTRFEPMTYDLRVDEETGHLVGTRNGEPYRLAPLVLVQADASECSEPPP